MPPSSSLVALYVTICSVLFIASKMLISFLLYKKWARKRRIIDNSLAGGKMVIFRSAAMLQSLSPKSFLGMLMGLSSKDVIGAGGYGTVYRLRVGDKAAFAVKRLNRGSAEMDRGFERELDTMGDIKHRNVVPLCGYYAAPHFNLLIYELMPNGSLDAVLHNQHQGSLLDWPARYRIALGVARGLSYLHHDCIPHVIHRDIKSSNILLDHDMEARLSDFGLATLMKPNASHVTTVVAGTFGYLAPEYFDTGRATTKGDVYSYGVVLLELLTGKRPTDESFLENGTRLVTWVKETMEEKREEHAIDEALLPCFPAEEVKLVFSVADKCLDSDPANRPTMAQVVKMLEQGKHT
ncbi:Receptor-like serine/threonine-protein kinase [Dichanthelium oligosanthes]|uniref:Receptor-like serine/threonine-protein kinase n=1 Tax=Dichanthelium oligosanthes TaxID=888268 RepID=A0A1E5V4S3_9POAL|nr:Receptor-like serine/threonine-protein kinase [Dichanthelium oligosanthes]